MKLNCIEQKVGANPISFTMLIHRRKVGFIMSINIKTLRNIVSSVFKVKASNIVLAESEISPNWRGQFSSGMSYGRCDESGDYGIYGYSPEKGFVEIGSCIATTHYSDGNHTQRYEESQTLAEVIGEEQFLFFLVIEGDNSDLPFSQSHTLHKAPNFKEYWDKVEAEDIERWEKWIEA